MVFSFLLVRTTKIETYYCLLEINAVSRICHLFVVLVVFVDGLLLDILENS
jgi:hypothetical protein